jgi:nitroreductase
MMNLLDAIKERRSIRKYKNDAVSNKLIEQMLEAARLAPSGSNSQPWRFIVVKNEKVRKEICQLCDGQRFIEEAPVNIVCFTDINRFSPEAMKNRWNELVEWKIAPTLSGELAKQEKWDKMALTQYRRAKALQTAISNTFIAIEHILLTATALGLGSCWVGAVNNAKFNQLFQLPDNMVSVAVLTVGYPAGQIPPPRPRISMKELLLKPLPEKN